MISVIKRDGTIVDFDLEKISIAIAGAFDEVGKQEFDNVNVLNDIEDICDSFGIIDVEDIQDIVEIVLMRYEYYEEAKAYVRYRYVHELARQHKNETEILQMIQGDSEYWTTENSNKDVRLTNTQRDYIAGIIDTDLARTFIFPRKAVEAHDDALIHIHDIDYAAERTLTNCCLVNLEDMLQNGTVINGIKIEKPHRLITATTIATQIIAAVSGAQYGGQTVSLTHLAPFVRMSFERYKDKYLEWGFTDIEANKMAQLDLKKEIQDSIQTLNYQLNSFCLARG